MHKDNQNIGDGSAADTTNGQQEKIRDSLYELEFRIKCALRYCKKRCNTFKFLHNLCIFITLFGGSAAFGAIEKYPLASIICGAFAAIIFSADAAIDFSRRSEKYNNLYKKFSDLLIKIQSASPDEALLTYVKNEWANIQLDVPTTLRVLDVLCHNQEATFQGIDDLYDIDWWHSLWKNVWAFDNWQPKKLSHKHPA